MTDPSKPYILIFTEHPGYLYVNLKAETISAEIIRDYIREVVSRSDATGNRRILLFRDIPAVLSRGQAFFMVNESLDALKGKQLALVNPHGEIKESIDFAMTVGQNRGGNYRSFDNVADAEAWLLKGVDFYFFAFARAPSGRAMSFSSE
jgi:hypothetical protein